MKKSLILICAALLPLCACSEKDTPSTEADFDHSEIVVQYEAMDGLSKYITITLEVDGKDEMVVNRVADSYKKTFENLPVSGTIAVKAVLNEDYEWNSESVDYSLSLTGHVATVSKSGGYSAIKTLDLPGKSESTGIKAEKARDLFESKARLLNCSFTYSIAADGSVSVE